MKTSARIGAVLLAGGLFTTTAHAAETSPQGIIKQALLGAGTGALSAELSDGKAGKGALIGAGTNVIGGALFGALFDAPTQSYSSYPSGYSSYAPAPVPVRYVQVPAQQPVYQTVYTVEPSRPVYVQPASYAPVSAPAADPNRKLIREGLLGAGVGAISAEASGGKAGTGALIGAGTGIIGGALFDTLLAPQTPQGTPVYYTSPTTGGRVPATGQRKIVRHFDKNGNVISEEEYFI